MKQLLIYLTVMGVHGLLLGQDAAQRTVELSSLEPIATVPADWPTINNRDLEADPLASYIPADQHAFFYPTFRKMMDFTDALKSGRETLEPLGFSVSRLEFYEQQMCVWLNGWSRFWGPKTIRGVALTGSDPYMAEGTDSAILFDAVIGKLVFNDTKSKQQEKLDEVKGARLIEGSAAGVAYRAVISPDRRVCSYLAQIDNVVIVTNSLIQLQKIIETSQKKRPSMRDTQEYRFFRALYGVEDHEQTGLVILPDAAIRRWLSPHWYIGQLRRRLAAQSMLEASSAEAESSAVYGADIFGTPIAELVIDRITVDEQRQYELFRERYQRQWQSTLGPAAICFLHASDRTSVDLTLRSRGAATSLGEYLAVGSRISPSATPQYRQSVVQFVMAVNEQSLFIRAMHQFLSKMAPAVLPQDSFSWLGDTLSVYVTDGEFLGKLFGQTSEAAGWRQSAVHNLNEAPAAFVMDVADRSKLDACLASICGNYSQAAGPFTCESRIYKGVAYKRLNGVYDGSPLTLYCAVIADRFVLSPSETLVQAAIDPAPRKRPRDIEPLGTSLCLHLTANGWETMEPLIREHYAKWIGRQAWSKSQSPGSSTSSGRRGRPLFTLRQADLGATIEEDGVQLSIRIEREKD